MSNYVDSLIERLSGRMPLEIQNSTILKIKNTPNFDYSNFLQPGSRKDVWSNCATLFCDLSDDQLIPYMEGLFLWLQDMNWPGAYEISQRLNRFEKERLQPYYQQAVDAAKETGDEEWLDFLEEYIELDHV